MVFFISEKLGDFILGDLSSEVPIRHRLKYRKEGEAYSVLDVENLELMFIDKKGFQILHSIDGKKNIKSILKKVAGKQKIPYFVLCAGFMKYFYILKTSGFVELDVELPYKFITKEMKPRALSSPNEISWFITNQCNLRCSHCGNTSRAKLKNELSTKEWFDFIDQCAKLNVFILNVSGGEPFMRKNWFELLMYARKKGMEIGITTNGTLINEKAVKQLKKVNPFNIHISLDGIGKVHDDFRNKKGVYNKVVQTVKLFKKHKIPFGITTSITKKNFHDLDNVKDFIKKHKINSWNLYFALPLGCLEKADAVSQKEYYKFAQKVVKYKKELKDITYISIGDSLGYYGSLKVRDDMWTGCGAGLMGCAVDAEGNVKGCPIQPSEFIEGNLKKSSLKAIWNKKGGFAYNRQGVKLTKHCKKCKYAKACRGGCKSSMQSQGTKLHYNDYCIHHIEQIKAF